MSTISVIIPTWNRADTLKRAVTSVLNQTYPIAEILVCDDGSTDNSKQSVLELNDERIKWLDGIHAGLPSIPRNRGISTSKGEWLAFLDNDDEWLPNKIEKQLQFASQKNTSAVSSNAYRIISGNKIQQPYLNNQVEILSFDQLIKNNYIICSSVLLKRNLFDLVYGFPEALELKAIEDYALWLRVATQTDFAYIKEPLVKYFDAPEQSIRANNISVLQQRKIILNDLLVWIEKIPSLKKSKYNNMVKLEIKKVRKMTNGGIFSLFQRKK